MQRSYLKGLHKLSDDDLMALTKHVTDRYKKLHKHGHHRLGSLFGEIGSLIKEEIENREKDETLPSLSELLERGCLPPASDFPEREDLK